MSCDASVPTTDLIHARGIQVQHRRVDSLPNGSHGRGGYECHRMCDRLTRPEDRCVYFVCMHGCERRRDDRKPSIISATHALWAQWVRPSSTLHLRARLSNYQSQERAYHTSSHHVLGQFRGFDDASSLISPCQCPLLIHVISVFAFRLASVAILLTVRLEPR